MKESIRLQPSTLNLATFAYASAHFWGTATRWKDLVLPTVVFLVSLLASNTAAAFPRGRVSERWLNVICVAGIAIAVLTSRSNPDLGSLAMLASVGIWLGIRISERKLHELVDLSFPVFGYSLFVALNNSGAVIGLGGTMLLALLVPSIIVGIVSEMLNIPGSFVYSGLWICMYLIGILGQEPNIDPYFAFAGLQVISLRVLDWVAKNRRKSS